MDTRSDIVQEDGHRPASGWQRPHLSVITAKLGLPSTTDRTRRSVNVRVLATLAFLRTTTFAE